MRKEKIVRFILSTMLFVIAGYFLSESLPLKAIIGITLIASSLAIQIDGVRNLLKEVKE